MGYSKDIDYQEKINEAVKNGDYAAAANYEKSRNEKIEGENLSYDKTNNYSMPSGVSGSNWNKANSTYSTTARQNSLDSSANSDLSNLRKVASNTNIISSDVWNAINSQFKTPTAVTEADAYLSSQLEKIQSGKTSYTDQVQNMMEQILNRDKFSYDVDKDPLFQQALASAMNSGKQAMQDTIGQASALTGGYGSTYATTAGNQAYNSFIEDAYNNLPQYYQMAMKAYQMEGDEMYNQLAMLNQADATEYERNITAYDATYQHRNQLYNEAYTQYRDNKSDAFNMANLQLSENNQLVNNAYNMYQASSNYADSMYSREYQQWSDSINQAFQIMQMQNSDYWNQANFDESVRQYEKNYAENVRQFDVNFAENQRQYNESMAENKRQFDEQMAYNKSRSSSGGSGGSGNPKTSSLTDSQLKTAEKLYVEAGGGDAGIEKVDGYLSTIGKNNLSEEAKDYLLNSLNEADIPVYYQNWTISKDTKNYFGGDDNNDLYSNGTTTMKYKDLKNSLKDSGLSESEQQKILDKWKSQSNK